MPYNPFFRAGLIEAWGRGIYKIISECETFGAVPPKFNCDFSGLMVDFGAKSEEVSGKTREKTREKTSGKTSRETTQKTTQKTTRKILSILKENPSTSRKEIAVILGDITEDGVKYQLNKMKKEKILERIGPAKGGYWKIIKE